MENVIGLEDVNEEEPMHLRIWMAALAAGGKVQGHIQICNIYGQRTRTCGLLV